VFHRFGPDRFVLHDYWWLGLIQALFFVGVVVLVIVFVARMANARHHHGPPGAWLGHHAPLPPAAVDPALTEARLRYARGEISREDYLRIVSDLTGQPPPG